MCTFTGSRNATDYSHPLTNSVPIFLHTLLLYVSAQVDNLYQMYYWNGTTVHTIQTFHRYVCLEYTSIHSGDQGKYFGSYYEAIGDLRCQ